MRKLKIILAFFLLLLITHYSLFITNCIAQWYPLPAFPTYLETSDVKFFDENTGILLLNNATNPIPGILRTTNGGQSWTQIINCSTYGNQKIDTTTMYIVTRLNGYNFIYRTFNKGLSWDSVSVNYAGAVYGYLSFVNKNTGWVTGFDGANYSVWRTTNGGLTLTPQSTDAGRGEVFFYNQKVNGEYIGWVNKVSALWKTTNSGNNWFQVACPGTELYQITFINENTGWASIGNMYKTTNGGLNWFQQLIAPGVSNLNRSLTKFNIINIDTIFGVGGYRQLPNSTISPVVWKTINSGLNWGYQKIDTSVSISYFTCIDFINPDKGWAYGENGANTINGGGEIIFTKIYKDEIILNDYKLFQNYPNPFNSISKIKYQISKSSDIKIKIFDIVGREIITLVNRKQNSGEYEVIFDGSYLSSGIYFYSIYIDEIRKDTKTMVLLK